MLLESQFSKLNSKYNVVLDSLKSVDKTATKAEIATSYYTTHLSYYTSYTVLFITLIATALSILNWSSLYRPTKIFVKKEIQKIQSLLDNFRNREIDSILEDLNSTTSFAYRSIALNHENTDPGVSFIFGIKILKMLNSKKIPKNKTASWRKNQIVFWVNKSLELLKKENFTIIKNKETINENIEILSNLIANVEYIDHRSVIIETLELYNKKIDDNLKKSSDK
jgi:hypothetical protein